MLQLGVLSTLSIIITHYPCATIRCFVDFVNNDYKLSMCYISGVLSTLSVMITCYQCATFQVLDTRREHTRTMDHFLRVLCVLGKLS